MRRFRSDQISERLVQIRVTELVAEVERPPRHHPLPAPQHLAELAAELQVEDEAGDGDDRRAAEGAAERLRAARRWWRGWGRSR